MNGKSVHFSFKGSVSCGCHQSCEKSSNLIRHEAQLIESKLLKDRMSNASSQDGNLISEQMAIDIAAIKKMRKKNKGLSSFDNENIHKDSIESVTGSSCLQQNSESYTFQQSLQCASPKNRIQLASPSIYKGKINESSLQVVGPAPPDFTIKKAYA